MAVKILLFSLCYLGSVLAVEKKEMSTYEMYTDLAKIINKQQCDISTGKGTGKGVHIENDNAVISMGTKKDVTLVRDGKKSLKVTAATVTLTGNLKSTTTDALISQLNAQAKLIKALQARLEKVETRPSGGAFQFQGTGCLHSFKNDYADSIFQSTISGNICGVRLYHSSGYVTCNKNSGGNVNTGAGRVSHWGCGPTGNSMGVFVTDMKRKNLYPGASAKYQGKDRWYTTDVKKGWTPMAEFLDFPGKMKVTKGQKFRLVYGEAYQNAHGNDNAGKTCAHVYFKMGKC